MLGRHCSRRAARLSELPSAAGDGPSREKGLAGDDAVVARALQHDAALPGTMRLVDMRARFVWVRVPSGAGVPSFCRRQT